MSAIFFSLLGEGEGGVEAPEGGGGSDFYGKAQEGGISRTGGAEGPGGCLQRIGEFLGGGGLNIFFRGRNVHQGEDFRKLLPSVFLPLSLLHVEVGWRFFSEAQFQERKGHINSEKSLGHEPGVCSCTKEIRRKKKKSKKAKKAKKKEKQRKTDT